MRIRNPGFWSGLRGVKGSGCELGIQILIQAGQSGGYTKRRKLWKLWTSFLRVQDFFRSFWNFSCLTVLFSNCQKSKNISPDQAGSECRKSKACWNRIQFSNISGSEFCQKPGSGSGSECKLRESESETVKKPIYLFISLVLRSDSVLDPEYINPDSATLLGGKYVLKSHGTLYVYRVPVMWMMWGGGRGGGGYSTFHVDTWVYERGGPKNVVPCHIWRASWVRGIGSPLASVPQTDNCSKQSGISAYYKTALKTQNVC